MKGFFGKVEAWYIEQDLHIYLGILTIVVGCFLIWMLDKQNDKVITLRNDNMELRSEILKKDSTISSLRSQLETSKPVSDVKVDDLVEKKANNLTKQLDKVQNVLINKVTTPTIKTQTQVKEVTIERKVDTNQELNKMMHQSYCSVNPQDKICKER